jgi:hypothetical protein
MGDRHSKHNLNHQLTSGKIAPVSGLYRTDHLKCATGDIWIPAGQLLPACSVCGTRATFSLEQEVDHISKDEDFR